MLPKAAPRERKLNVSKPSGDEISALQSMGCLCEHRPLVTTKLTARIVSALHAAELKPAELTLPVVVAE